jgi:hypothetical protein
MNKGKYILLVIGIGFAIGFAAKQTVAVLPSEGILKDEELIFFTDKAQEIAGTHRTRSRPPRNLQGHLEHIRYPHAACREAVNKLTTPTQHDFLQFQSKTTLKIGVLL